MNEPKTTDKITNCQMLQRWGIIKAYEVLIDKPEEGERKAFPYIEVTVNLEEYEEDGLNTKTETKHFEQWGQARLYAKMRLTEGYPLAFRVDIEEIDDRYKPQFVLKSEEWERAEDGSGEAIMTGHDYTKGRILK